MSLHGISMAEVDLADRAAGEASPKLAIVKSDSLGCQAFTFNVGNGKGAESPVGRDARVRRAFELSIDREALAGVVFNSLHAANAQAISPDSPFNLPGLKPPARDVAAAKDLFAEAGVTGFRRSAGVPEPPTARRRPVVKLPAAGPAVRR